LADARKFVFQATFNLALASLIKYLQGHAQLAVIQKKLVLIVDDDPMCRVGIRACLGLDEDLVVVGEASNGIEAVDQVRSSGPHLVLMDVKMPLMDGVEATQRIKEHDSSVKVIMLSALSTDSEVLGAIRAGANGYCLKESNPERLLAAIKAVEEGELWLDSPIAEVLVRNLTGNPKTPSSSVAPPVEVPEEKTDPNAISGEEMQLLGLLVQGHSQEQLVRMMSTTADGLKEMQKRVLDKIALAQTGKDTNGQAVEGEHDENGHPLRCPTCNNLFASGETPVCPHDGERLTTAQSDPLSGTIFANKFEILSLIGRGSGGAVYKAKHIFTNRMLAVKVMHGGLMRNLKLIRRFRQEAEAASSLDHPNVLSVLDFGLTPDGQAYMVMDMLNGPSLSDLLDKLGRLDLNDTVRIFAQCCDGLGHAHRKGIIHRDFKPSNIILVGSTDGLGLAKIVDFGIVKMAQHKSHSNPELTLQGEVCGTPYYMSPEQCISLDLTPASDIYSWGASFYEALSGSPPFSAPSILELMHKHIYEAPVPLHEVCQVPTVLSEVVMQCLQKDPASRFQTMGDVKDALLYASGIAGVSLRE
jgi:DNA-binding NarL/FixJ family response regulator